MLHFGLTSNAGFDDAYITWVSDGKLAWTVNSGGLAADNRVEIGPRPIPQEPLVRVYFFQLFETADCVFVAVHYHELGHVAKFRRR